MSITQTATEAGKTVKGLFDSTQKSVSNVFGLLPKKESDESSSKDGEPAVIVEPKELPYKMVLPEPIEKATQHALVTVEEWWKQMEPLLQKLIQQIMAHIDPYLKASEAQFKALQENLAPHADKYMTMMVTFKDNLEPQAKAAVEKIKAASAALQVQAYGPALEAVAQATAAVQAHAKATAELVHKNAVVGYDATSAWLKEHEPLFEKIREMIMEYSAALIAALIEWQKQLEPIVQAQMQVLQVKALEMGKEIQAVHLPKLGSFAKEQYVAHAEPHVIKAKAFVGEKVQENWAKIEPSIRPAITWTEETGKKLQPYTEPAGKAIAEWSCLAFDWLKVQAGILFEKAKVQAGVWAKQLEAPMGEFQQYLAKQLECLCLPVQQKLAYKKAAAEGTYPAPAYVAPPEPTPTAPAATPVD